MKKLIVLICVVSAIPALCYSGEEPFAWVIPSSQWYSTNNPSCPDLLEACFVSLVSIYRPFTVFSVIIFPDGKKMLDTRTLGPRIKPLISNVPSIDGPLSYPLISLKLPPKVPLGQYEIVVAFFDPSHPIQGRRSAFLDVSAAFEIVGSDFVIPTPTPTVTPIVPTPTPTPEWYTKYGPDGTGDVVKIGTLYVVSKKEGIGCASGACDTWYSNSNWADNLHWLDRDDWRLPTLDELQAICAAKDTAPGFTYDEDYSSYWSSTSHSENMAKCVDFETPWEYCYEFNGDKNQCWFVRIVRDAK